MFKPRLINTPMGTFTAPNDMIDFKDFYISFNDTDIGTYGDDTTAIVIGVMERFYILNGDHSKALNEAAKSGGLQHCLDYFFANVAQANKLSEHNLTPEQLKRISTGGKKG
jgi:hypothetical protein